MISPQADTMTLQDAVKVTGPRAFNLMIKPAGSLCNLDCSYCYYLDKSDLYGGREPRMGPDMLETVIRSYIEANDVDEVQFNWHGGEPLVMGLDFYRRAVELELKYASGKKVYNTIQTNGTLLDSRWAEFLREHNFLVGISLDGPEDIHDRYRKDKGGKPTFARVMAGVGLLASAGVDFNTMTTVNHCSEGRGLEVYKFLKGIGSRYMQFMPVVEHVRYPSGAKGKPVKSSRPFIVEPHTPGSCIAPWSVGSLAFGKFMTDIFDYWVRNDVGEYFVGLFDATLARYMGLVPGSCAYSRTCGDCAVIEHNGDVYPCDHFVYSGRLLGNVKERSIAEMMDSEAMVRFGIDKSASLPSTCRRCPWLALCNGECPKHRFCLTDSGETGLNALCEGYKYFYSHSDPYMRHMKALIEMDEAPRAVIPWARERNI